MSLTAAVRYSVFAVMDLETRHVEAAGIVREAYENWMIQIVTQFLLPVFGTC